MRVHLHIRILGYPIPGGRAFDAVNSFQGDGSDDQLDLCALGLLLKSGDPCVDLLLFADFGIGLE